MLLEQTPLCVNAYPRYGNSYLADAIYYFLEKNKIMHINFTSHGHSILEDDTINQVTILRNPLECIPSYALFYLWPLLKTIKKEEIEEFVNDITELYIIFTNHMKNSENVLFIFFEDLIKKDINYFLKGIFNYFHINIPDNSIFLNHANLVRFKELSKVRVSNNVYKGNYPRDYSLMPERPLIIDIVKNGIFYKEATNKYYETKEYFQSSEGISRLL